MNFAGCLTALETATSGLACVVLKKWRGRENDLGRALPSAPAKVQGLLFFEACLLSRAVLGLSWLATCLGCCFAAVLGLSWLVSALLRVSWARPGAVLKLSWACLGLSYVIIWAPLGTRATLGHVLVLSCCCFEAVLGLSWAVLHHGLGTPRH